MSYRFRIKFPTSLTKTPATTQLLLEETGTRLELLTWFNHEINDSSTYDDAMKT